jgi:thioredoxin-like negative regulator of GroEL
MKLYYFSAPWCGPCKVLGPQMEKSGLAYTKVNVDNETELSTKFGVRNVPTLLKVDSQGNEISRIVGVKPIIEIKNWYNG